MNKTLIAALVAAGQLLLAQPARAITFTFSWGSDANGLTVIGGGPIHSAAGTVDINVRPGQPFNRGDITNIDITVTDGTNTLQLGNLNLSQWTGIVDGSGTFASTFLIFFDGGLVDTSNLTILWTHKYFF